MQKLFVVNCTLLQHVLLLAVDVTFMVQQVRPMQQFAESAKAVQPARTFNKHFHQHL